MLFLPKKNDERMHWGRGLKTNGKGIEFFLKQ